MNTSLFEGVIFGYQLILTPWKIIGLIGTLMFASRWIVQMYYSREAGKPVTPRLFWVMSMVGSLMTLAYFSLSIKPDIVGICGNFFPSFIAGYNLYLDLTHRRKALAAETLAQGQVPAPQLTPLTTTPEL